MSITTTLSHSNLSTTQMADMVLEQFKYNDLFVLDKSMTDDEEIGIQYLHIASLVYPIRKNQYALTTKGKDILKSGGIQANIDRTLEEVRKRRKKRIYKVITKVGTFLYDYLKPIIIAVISTGVAIYIWG